MVAIFLMQDYVFSLNYLLLDTYIIARWWGWRALQGLAIQRHASARMFLGEQA